MFFKKKIKNNNIYDHEMCKILPTYYEKYAKNIVHKNNFYEFQLVNNNEDEFEIYYYGELLKNKFIIGTDDARSLVVAKDKYSNEIILFDGLIHGYDNLSWQEHDEKELRFESKLIKLNIGYVKVFVYVELLDDKDEDWDLDSENNVIGEHNKKIPWEVFIRNAFTWLTIDVITSNNKKINIVDEELA